MTSKLATKIRLVKCPKCRQLLPELADVPVYKCGGCGTTLQAKNKKNDARSTKSVIQETDAAQTNALDPVTEDKESSSSSHKEILPSSEECSLDQSNERDQNQSTDCNSEQLGGMNLSNEDQNNERDQSQSGDCNGEQLGDINLSDEDQNNERDQTQSGDCNNEQGINLSDEDQNSERDQTQSGDCNSEQLGGINLSDDDQNNETDQTQSGDCNSEQLGGINLSDEDENKETDQTQSGDFNSEQLGGIKLSNEDQNNGTDQIESCDCSIKQPRVSNEVCLSSELATHGNEESSPIAGADSEVEINGEGLPLAGADSGVEINGEELLLAGADLEVEIIGEGLPLAGAKSEVDINEGDSNFRSPSTDNLVSTMGNTSVIAHHRPARESISSDTVTSSLNEQLEQPQKSVHMFDRVRSTDAIEAMEFMNPSSELSRKLREMSKSPTTKSYYAYDGSVSSFDGTDDQFSDQHIHSSKSTYKVPDFVVLEERHKKGKFLVNSMMNCSSEMHHQARNSSSFLFTKKHSANKCSNWDQDELPEPTRHGRPGRNGRRHERDDHPSRMLFNQRSSLAGYENGGPSNQVHDQFHFNTRFHSSDKFENPEEDNMKLLRMVSELQDQINKKCYPNVKADGRPPTWKEKHTPTYYNDEAPDEEFRHDLNYPRFPGRGRQGSNWLPKRNSRIPFSGEATSSRHQVDRSCLHCCPQDWQCSGELPPPILPHNKGLSRLHSNNNCYNSYSSCPSSPQWYVDSEFPVWGRETKSAEQRLRDHEGKKYPREKYHLAKRHFRPLAGGAPFVTCYNCLSPLQLPADFLLFRRRFHRLRCGACSEVLKFTLQNRTHIAPYALDAIADPPPSEVDDYSDATNRRLVSASHANAYPHADPVSCSDDYGLSYCKSGSTEGDPVYLTSFHALQGIVDDRNMSANPFEPMGVRKEFVFKQSQNKNANFLETNGSARPSSSMSEAEKFSSEIEELPQTSSSPLHRLMGYSSPSQVINGLGPSGM